MADDIVELIILTADEVFLRTLRDAVGDTRRLWHVPTADKVGDLLVAGQVGILVLDVQALHEDAAVFISRIKRQFPDLVVVAAGGRDAESSLANLISTGSVYRFIHMPMSPGRAKLFADAAVRRHGELRRRVTAADATPPAAKRRLMAGAATGGLAVVIAAVWALHHDASRPRSSADESTATAVSPPTAAATAARDAADRSGFAAAEGALARAETALLAGRLEAAAAAIAAGRRAGADSGRIAFLSAQLARSRDRIDRIKAAAGTARDDSRR